MFSYLSLWSDRDAMLGPSSYLRRSISSELVKSGATCMWTGTCLACWEAAAGSLPTLASYFSKVRFLKGGVTEKTGETNISSGSFPKWPPKAPDWTKLKPVTWDFIQVWILQFQEKNVLVNIFWNKLYFNYSKAKKDNIYQKMSLYWSYFAVLLLMLPVSHLSYSQRA